MPPPGFGMPPPGFGMPPPGFGVPPPGLSALPPPAAKATTDPGMPAKKFAAPPPSLPPALPADGGASRDPASASDGAAAAPEAASKPSTETPSVKKIVRQTKSFRVTATIKAFSDIEGTFGILDILHKVHEASVRLIVATDELKLIVPVEATELTIGRVEDCDLAITHASVSSRHAVIRFLPEEEVFVLIDGHSTNKTFVNGKAIAAGVPQVLQPHSAVTFGAVPCLFAFDPEALKKGPQVPRATDHELAQYLVTSAILTRDQVKDALIEAAQSQVSLGEAIVHAGLLPPERWASIYQDEAPKRKKGTAASKGRSGTIRIVAGLGIVVVVVVLILLALRS